MEGEWSPQLRRDLELRLQNAQRLETVGLLTGGIVHDINNLLTGVLGYADLALAQIDGQSLVRECLENIKATAHRAADVARYTLSFSGQTEGGFESIDMSIVVAALKGLVDVSLPKKTSVVFQLAENLPMIWGNATQLHQLAMNLLLNASEALDNLNGTVTVSTRLVAATSSAPNGIVFPSPPACDTLVCLEVADSGRGMSESTRRRLFDPFYSTKNECRGLGLTVVERIVAAHSGAIDIRTAPGEGTTFRIYFPLAGTRPVVPNPAEIVSANPIAGKLLIVDDEAIVRISTKELAETAGYVALTAESGLEAIEIYRNVSDIHCVVLDMTMPKLDGLETLTELRRIDPNVRVLLTSGGYPSAAIKNHPAAGNIVGYLQKPYDFSALLESLRSVVDS